MISDNAIIIYFQTVNVYLITSLSKYFYYYIKLIN
jgi:hypothetical protein